MQGWTKGREGKWHALIRDRKVSGEAKGSVSCITLVRFRSAFSDASAFHIKYFNRQKRD